MSAIPPRLSERIQRPIDAMETDGEAKWMQRVCKEKLNSLPLRGDGLTQWALRADGAVLELDLDSASLPFHEALDPLVRYAVFQEAARLDPELAELVPPRPPGVVQCERCGGTGWTAETGSACGGCGALGWHVQRRPVDEWMERIDRGDQLHLRAEGDTHGLVAGRLAGYYVARGDGLPYWSIPVGSRGRHQLDEHLRRFGYAHRRQKHVTATWQRNATGVNDPFDSDWVLRFSGTGSGGSYSVEFVRQPDGRYHMRTTLENDFDPLGGAEPTVTTAELDAGAARGEAEREMRDSGSWNPFPAFVPRNSR